MVPPTLLCQGTMDPPLPSPAWGEQGWGAAVYPPLSCEVFGRGREEEGAFSDPVWGTGGSLAPSSPPQGSGRCLGWWGLGPFQSLPKTASEMPFPDLGGVSGGPTEPLPHVPRLRWVLDHRPSPRGLPGGILQLFLGPMSPPCWCPSGATCPVSSPPPRFSFVRQMFSSQKWPCFFNVFCLWFLIKPLVL